MGRELRLVPPNWDHPKTENRDSGKLEFQRMHNQTFADASREWKEEFAKWEAGWRPDYYTEEDRNSEYWEYAGDPPVREYYRPWSDAEATWFQVWETVSEGTPVTPPFATREELATYLIANGDFWDQRRGDGGWRPEAARAFVKDGWAPSMVVVQSPDGAQIFEPRDGRPA